MKPVKRIRAMTEAAKQKMHGITNNFANLVEPVQSNRRLGGQRTSRLFKQSFMGLPADYCYWDPMGSRVEGGVNLVGAPGGMRDMVMPAVKAFQKAFDAGYPMEEAVWEYRRVGKKTLTSSAWNIPVFAVRGTPIVSPGALPAATLFSRITTDKDEIQTTPLTTVAAAANIAEGDANYTFNDDTYHGGTVGNYAYAIKGYGRGNKVSELMSMVGGSIANPRQTNAAAELLAIRRYEEIQTIQGTNNAGGFSGDPLGFKGNFDFSAFGDFGSLVDQAGAAITAPDTLRTMIDTLVNTNGADPDMLLGFTDTVTLTGIKNDLQDYVRTGDPHKNFVMLDPTNNVNIKLRPVVIDGVKIFPSFGSPTTATKREVNFMDARDHYYGMVQDAVLKPLAKIGPHEDMATDAYGAFVSEGYAHCGRIKNIA